MAKFDVAHDRDTLQSLSNVRTPRSYYGKSRTLGSRDSVLPSTVRIGVSTRSQSKRNKKASNAEAKGYNRSVYTGNNQKLGQSLPALYKQHPQSNER